MKRLWRLLSSTFCLSFPTLLLSSAVPPSIPLLCSSSPSCLLPRHLRFFLISSTVTSPPPRSPFPPHILHLSVTTPTSVTTAFHPNLISLLYLPLAPSASLIVIGIILVFFIMSLSLCSTHSRTHRWQNWGASVQRFQMSSFTCCLTEDILIPDNDGRKKLSCLTLSANSTTSEVNFSF